MQKNFTILYIENKEEFHMNCHFCRDKKKFNSKLQNAERILKHLQELSRLIPKDFTISEKEIQEKYKINYRSHIRFTCSHCKIVNTNRLYFIERKILEESYKLYIYAKHITDKRIIGQIRGRGRQLLSGHYPNIAALFYKI